MKTTAAAAFVFCFVFHFLQPSAFGQGSLTPPPGSPAPTFKTLQQVEPRIDLQNAPASAVDTTNANSHFVINQPGSYYLSANIGVTKTNGILIDADGVTVDLNGFEISRTSGSGGGGVINNPAVNRNRNSVRNGTVRGFATGVQLNGRGAVIRDLSVSNCTLVGIDGDDGAVIESCRLQDISGSVGINVSSASSVIDCSVANVNVTVQNGIFAAAGCTLINCAVSGNAGGDSGIQARGGSSLINCSAVFNKSTNGIHVSDGVTLTNCNAGFNSGTFGIFTENGCSLANCNARENTSAAAVSAGIATGSHCTLTHCTASNNLSTATSSATTGMGFDVGEGTIVQNCTASNNKGDGIRISNDALVRDNSADSNGNSGDGAGIHATGGDARIEGNNVTDNDRGIDVDAAGNMIVKNSASGNTTNFDIAAGNFFGAIVNAVVPAGSPTPAPVNGSAAGSSITTTDPWANISY